MSDAVRRILDAVGGDESLWLAFVEAASWPADALARIVADKITDAADPRAALDALDAEEIGLACACAAGDAAALRAFDRRFVAGIDRELIRVGLDPALVDDVKQRVRTKLLTPDEGGAIKLLEYAGQGRLAGFVKVVGVRMALDIVRARKPDLVDDDDRAADAMLDRGLSPELEAVHREHRDAIRAAFAQAIGELEARDRAILRLHLLEGLSIDGIAGLHRVHRGTAARWIVRLRDRIAARTRELLAATLALDTAALDSLFHAVESQLDLSLSRLLNAP